MHEGQGKHALSLDQRVGGERLNEHPHEPMRLAATGSPLDRPNVHG
jgi:hypothetical protein